MSALLYLAGLLIGLGIGIPIALRIMDWMDMKSKHSGEQK